MQFCRALAGLIFSAVLVGCQTIHPIQKVSASKSPFEDAFYKGKTTVIDDTANLDEYRAFHQAATGYESILNIERYVDDKAVRFCSSKGMNTKPLRVTTSEPPHILGNFPRAELVFACESPGEAPPKNAKSPNANSEGSGTGFAVNKGTLIVTAFHVVENAKAIKLTCSPGKEASAKVVRIDPANDLALMETNSPAEFYFRVAPDNSVKVGQKVYTVGFPVPGMLGLDAKYSDGTVNSLTGISGAANLMQISVPLQPGNSGGPLVDFSGRLIGIVTSTAAVQGFLRNTGTLPQNINWAVRSEYLRPLLSGHESSGERGRATSVEQSLKGICLVKAER